jgi:hypothetical protein
MIKLINLVKLLVFATIVVSVFGCRGAIGLPKSPESVAYVYLRGLYQAKFDNLDKVAAGDALMIAALLQGRLSEDENVRSLFNSNADALITQLTLDNNRALATFKVTFSDGSQLDNRLTLYKQQGKWLVYAIEKSPLPAMPSFYNKEDNTIIN